MPGGALKERVDRKPHPGGVAGAMLSLDEVARRAWASRLDPRVRAWSTQVLAKAGWPSTRIARVQALADAYHAKVKYLEDPPKVEFMASPVQLLCLDDHGLCIVGADCDEATITGAACCLSVAIEPVRIVGASYKPPLEQPTHVYFEFLSERRQWIPADFSTTQPIGVVARPAQTWYVDPDKGVGAAGLPGGDFVGVSGLPGGPIEGYFGPFEEIRGWYRVRRPRR